MKQKGAKVKNRSYGLGKGHEYDIVRMTSTPLLFGIPSGTMVETRSVPEDGDRYPSRTSYNDHLLITYPSLSSELGLSKLESGNWGIETNSYLYLEDSSLLELTHHVIGPLRGVEYRDGGRDPIVYPGSPYSRGELPLGTVGMVMKSVRLEPSKTFYGLEDLSFKKELSSGPNFYIVFVSSILDVVRGGYWFWPAKETIRFNKSKEIGINNFNIYSVYDKEKKMKV